MSTNPQEGQPTNRIVNPLCHESDIHERREPKTRLTKARMTAQVKAKKAQAIFVAATVDSPIHNDETTSPRLGKITIDEQSVTDY
jgi:hypothetical protein